MLTPAITCSSYTYDIINLSGTVVTTGTMDLLQTNIYSFNFTESEGDYIIRLCDDTTREVRVEEEEDKMIIAIIILLPMILAIVFLIGAFITDADEHRLLKLFLFLASMIPFFTSMHLAMISLVKFYNFPEMQDLIGSTVYWVGIIFFIILTYFMMYVFYIATHVAAQKKKERLNY
jgi:hypothetical protein|tara:strand:+ start:884 stop:1411 length:528 start_codon:yes stop_codon:yes gene_type:complete